jgi:hypothetical protein
MNLFVINVIKEKYKDMKTTDGTRETRKNKRNDVRKAVRVVHEESWTRSISNTEYVVGR